MCQGIRRSVVRPAGRAPPSRPEQQFLGVPQDHSPSQDLAHRVYKAGVRQCVRSEHRILGHEGAPRRALYQAVEVVRGEPCQLCQVRDPQAAVRHGKQPRDRFAQRGGVGWGLSESRCPGDGQERSQMTALTQWMPLFGNVAGKGGTASERGDDAHVGRWDGGQKRGDALARGSPYDPVRAFEFVPEAGPGLRSPALACPARPRHVARPGHVVVESVDHEQEVPPVRRALVGGFGEEGVPRPGALGDQAPGPAEKAVDLAGDLVLEVGSCVRAVGRGDKEGQYVATDRRLLTDEASEQRRLAHGAVGVPAQVGRCPGTEILGKRLHLRTFSRPHADLGRGNTGSRAVQPDEAKARLRLPSVRRNLPVLRAPCLLLRLP